MLALKNHLFSDILVVSFLVKEWLVVTSASALEATLWRWAEGL